MEVIITFLIRSSLTLLIFSGAYYLLKLAGMPPAFNRFYILGSFLVSILLPAIPFTGFSTTVASEQLNIVMLPELVIKASEESSQITSTILETFSSASFLIWMIAGFSVLMVLSSVINLLRIYRLSRYHSSIQKQGMHVVLLNKPISPFSFFRLVFIPESLLQKEYFSIILAHEKAHYQKGHSWDILFLECMRVLFWFNPIFYLLHKEIKAQHEFEADELTCQSTPKTKYQLALLEYTLSGTFVPLTNPFNVSLIKQRIMMMNRSTKLAIGRLWWKTFIILPFLMLAIAVQSCQDVKTEDDALEPEPATTAEMIEEAPSVSEPGEDEEILHVVDQQPRYPGGDEARIRFLQEHLVYPKEAREAGEQGTVFVSFIVSKDGNISNVKILRGVSPELDAEAIRVIEKMPTWEPGYHQGEVVNVQFNMPIRFVLQDDTSQAVIVVE